MSRKVVKTADGRRFASFGLKPPIGERALERDFEPSGRDLPTSIDLRRHCTAVEDQSQSNSCSANATAGAYEYLCKKYCNETGDTPGDISRLFIYYIGRKRDLERQGDINGPVRDVGMCIGSGVDAMKLKGACLAEEWPFDLSNVNARPSEEAFEGAVKYKISEAFSVPVDLDVMKGALADGYPIITGLKLTQNFFNPGPSGRILTPDPDDPQSAEHGLHAMLIVGFSDEQQVFIYRNSWGDWWGDQGYGYVPYEYGANSQFNFCGQYVIKGVTEVDLTPNDEDQQAVVPDPPEEQQESEPVEVEEEQDESEVVVLDMDDLDLFNQEAELRRVFNKFDLDGSGSMGSGELLMALWYMGHFATPFSVGDLLSQFDKDESSRLEFDEWCAVNATFDQS